MSVKWIRIAFFLTVLVLMAVVSPVTHDVHETVDHHCTLCQLGHSSTGDVVKVQAVVHDFESVQWIPEGLVKSFGSLPYLPSGSRAPPA